MGHDVVQLAKKKSTTRTCPRSAASETAWPCWSAIVKEGTRPTEGSAEAVAWARRAATATVAATVATPRAVSTRFSTRSLGRLSVIGAHSCALRQQVTMRQGVAHEYRGRPRPGEWLGRSPNLAVQRAQFVVEPPIRLVFAGPWRWRGHLSRG